MYIQRENRSTGIHRCYRPHFPQAPIEVVEVVHFGAMPFTLLSEPKVVQGAASGVCPGTSSHGVEASPRVRPVSEWTSPCSLQKCRPSSVLIGTGAVATPDGPGGRGDREALGVSRSQAIHRGGGHGGVVATAPGVPTALGPTPTRPNDAVVVARCRALELEPRQDRACTPPS